MKHLLTDFDWNAAELKALLQQAATLKAHPADYAQALAGKSVALLFEKPSLRTRVTFELGAQQLGALVVYLDQSHGALGKREPVGDFAQNLSCWVNAIVARTYSQATLDELAAKGSVPVINALSDRFHPCQGLADMLSLYEVFGKLEGVKLAYVGDGNNVTHSLMILSKLLGVEMLVVTPKGCEPAADIIQATGIQVTDDMAALEGVDAIYTDTWISMGDDKDPEAVLKTFLPYQINGDVMKKSGAKAFMHCLPAYRGKEVTAEVLEGPQSIVLRQAENRLHVQKAVFLKLLKED
ncbi:ornithine carbamoyltransferase [Gallaecimonas kandeliae]|uniref:ornithine carbamoyltransferase n=1 Tax=Gallaecimonas kandeliae TaxID=3029055 RepID=UPI0026491CD5|nr:ornithine carbamoyltransferase [Gallaecimonas kandeliae]WKE65296.1 ornithine carbamoyltransferase [Gallaecimonas kandeliae]